jgi:hypothetical protein
MVDNPGDGPLPARPWTPVRMAALLIAAAEALVFLAIVVAAATADDPLGRNIWWGLAQASLFPFVVGVLPALALAALGRWPPLALLLALAVAAAVALAFPHL